MNTEITTSTPPGLAAALTTPTVLAHVDVESLDATLPGVRVLADQLDAHLVRHRDMRVAAYLDESAYERAEIEAEASALAAKVRGMWEAAHLVAGAEAQARRTVDGILRPYVVDADREARLARPAGEHASPAELDLSSAHNRASGRMRSLVRDLAARHYATEERALP